MNAHSGKKLCPDLRERSRSLAEDFEKLRLAAIRGKIDGIVGAIEKGISVNQVLKGGWTPLLYASSVGHSQTVNYLLNHGADPNFHKELFTPLMAVSASSRECEDELVECSERLVEAGGIVDAFERHRLTPLIFAAINGRQKLVVFFTRAGANLQHQDSQGWTALFWAVNQGKTQAVEALIKLGAEVGIKDRKGQTALDLAVAKRLHEIADIIWGRTGLTEVKETMATKSYKEDLKHIILTSLTDIANNNKDRLVSEQLEKVLLSTSLEKNINYNEACINYADPKKEDVVNCRAPYSLIDGVNAMRSTFENIKILFERISYIRIRLQGRPLNYPSDYVASSLNSFQKLTAKSIQQSQLLHQELFFLNKHTKQIDGSESNISADVIAHSKYSYASKLATCAFLTIALIVTLGHMKLLSLPVKTYFSS